MKPRYISLFSGLGSADHGFDAAGRENSGREVVWFSPGCLKPDMQAMMFPL